jgi:hypothetical protein
VITYRALIVIVVLLSACTHSEVRDAKAILAKTATADLQSFPTSNSSFLRENTPAATKTDGSENIRITTSGIYSVVDINRVVRTPKTIARRSNLMNSARLVKATDVIPARIDTVFGFEFLLPHIGRLEEVILTIKLIHPPMKEPGSMNAAKEGEYDVSVDFSNRQVAFFCFNREWELVPGKWTFQVYYKEQLLTEKSFTVVLDQNLGD